MIGFGSEVGERTDKVGVIPCIIAIDELGVAAHESEGHKLRVQDSCSSGLNAQKVTSLMKSAVHMTAAEMLSASSVRDVPSVAAAVWSQP